MKYHFANHTLDVERHEFCRDESPISIEPQVFDLLHLLVQSAGLLVSRDQLVDEIWGGRIVSESTISARINAARRAVGDSGKDQKVIKTIARRGIQFVADVEVEEKSKQFDTADAAGSQKKSNQTVRFVTSNDGTEIAFATSGNGPPLLRASHWLTHLEFDWHSPVWRPLLDALGANSTVVRYDQRGTGLSDRSLRGSNLEDFSADLEAVADAAGLDRFPIFAASQGVPVAIHFAAHYPERVSKLVLYGGYVEGAVIRDANTDNNTSEAILTLIRNGWGQPESAFMKAFSSLFMPTATPEQIDSFVKMQLASASPENAAKIRSAVDRFSVVDLLEKIKAPTLVIHARNDAVHPLKQGQLLASGIPNAQFLQLESNNHAPLPHEDAWGVMISATLDFLSE